MQPLKTMVHCPCSSTIGCAPASLRSMIAKRRWPSAALPSCHSPPPSGPRATIASVMAAVRHPFGDEPSKRISPHNPHIVRRSPALHVGPKRRARLRVLRWYPACCPEKRAEDPSGLVRPPGEGVAEPVDEAHPGTERLVEQRAVRRGRVGAGRRGLLRRLDLAADLDKLFGRDGCPQLRELLGLLVGDVIAQHGLQPSEDIEELGVLAVGAFELLH